MEEREISINKENQHHLFRVYTVPRTVLCPFFGHAYYSQLSLKSLFSQMKLEIRDVKTHFLRSQSK